MGSGVATKIIGAAVAALVVELTDRILDNLGLPKESARVQREVIKAVISVVVVGVVADVLEKSLKG